MKLSELLEDVKKAEQDIAKKVSKEIRSVERKEHKLIKFLKGPFKYLLALIIILLMVLWIVPGYGVKLDPSPKYIPTTNEILTEDLLKEIESQINIDELGKPVASYNDYLALIYPNDPIIKRVADRVVTTACQGVIENYEVCYAKAIFFFVRDNFNYVPDPSIYDYVKTAKESLYNRGGDCDDASVLGANLLESIGIHTRFVFIPGHVYVQIKLPNALKKYKQKKEMEKGWINQDFTCKSCDFGETPYTTYGKKKVYVG